MELQAIYIRSYQQRTVPDKHIAYAIEIHSRNRTWTVWRRYSEFEGMAKEMELELSTSGNLVSSKGKSSWHIPDLPVKRGSSMLTPWRGASEEFLKERQTGLERFLRGILGSKDDLAERCRGSRAWKGFLGDSSTSSSLLSSSSLTGHVIKEGKDKGSFSSTRTDFTTSTWLDEYQSLEMQAKEVQSSISKRDTLLDRGDTTSAHQASVHAKQLLAVIVGRLTVLAKGLDETRTTMSEGELRRRTDMMAKLQDKAHVLSKLSSATTTRASPSTTSTGRSDASLASRSALLGPASLHTAQPVSRVLGKQSHAPVQETEQTRVLDNSGLLQMQLQEIDQQDERVTSLTAVIRRQRELATAIGVELEHQNELLDGVSCLYPCLSIPRSTANLLDLDCLQLSNDVDRTGAKLGSAKKQLKRLE